MPDPSPARVPAVAAGLRTIAHRLTAGTAQLYAAGDAGRLRLVASEGAAAPDLAALAETLSPAAAALDVSGAVEGVRFAVGQRSGQAALLVLGVDPDRLGASWYAAFADAVAVADALASWSVTAAPDGTAGGHARLLHEVATHPGSFDERLALGLAGLAAALGVDAAAFATVEDGVWTPEAVADPYGLLPAGAVPLASLPCALTFRADGPVAIERAEAGLGTYLGTPVFAGGRTVGTLVAVGRAARAVPFSADDRALSESLARWIGSGLGGRTAARQLADREAALSAFVDRAPVAMGLTVLDEGDDLHFVSVNAAATALFGQGPDALAGLRASEAGLDERARRAWAAGGRHVLRAAPGEARRTVDLDLDTPAGTRTLTVTLGRLDVHDADGTAVACVSFVAEDVTEREQGLRLSAEGRRLAEAAGDTQTALFERLHRDLRSPLTTILGYADLLDPDGPPDDVEAVREVVLRSGRQLLATLDDAVELADASRVTLSLVPTDAVALVRSVVDAHRAAAGAAGVELAFEAAAAAAPLLLDPALVGRAVRALVGVAVAVPGARHVDARLTDDGGQLVFDVGVRESSAVLPASGPEPFALVDRLVERAGGHVDVHPDGAWRWTVRLPRHPVPVVDLPPGALPAEALVSTVAGGEAGVRAAAGRPA